MHNFLLIFNKLKGELQEALKVLPVEFKLLQPAIFRVPSTLFVL